MQLEARLGGMVNICELPINAVTVGEPKMLIGSCPKGTSDLVITLSALGIRRLKSHRQKGRT
jgi:hypothetical protein